MIGIDLLLNGLGQKPNQIHAIGHSLGGQLVGHFGRKIKENGGQGEIGRISCKFFTSDFLVFYRTLVYNNCSDAARELISREFSRMNWQNILENESSILEKLFFLNLW